MKRVRALVPALAALASALLLRAVIAAPAKTPPKPTPKAPPGPDAAGPPTTLGATARVARVRVEVSPGGAAVTHDLVFPKGALAVQGSGEPTVFVAFTAQARPLAIEATRHALDDAGHLAAASGKVEIVDVFTRPKTAAIVLGPPSQAGHVLRVPRDDAPFGLRVRSAIPTHALAAPTPTVSILARLGVRGLGPAPVDAIEVGAILGGSLRGARATFCGDGADPRPLTLTFLGFPTGDAGAGDAGVTIAPSAAARTANDDLCIDVLI